LRTEGEGATAVPQAWANANTLESNHVCDAQHAGCEDALELLAAMRLPSMRKFDIGVSVCCLGVGFTPNLSSEITLNSRLQLATWP
jgi:hypothetical protein